MPTDKRRGRREVIAQWSVCLEIAEVPEALRHIGVEIVSSPRWGNSFHGWDSFGDDNDWGEKELRWPTRYRKP